MQIIQNDDATWRVERDGQIIANGLSHARAWEVVDAHDRQAQSDEETRRRIDIAMGQW